MVEMIVKWREASQDKDQALREKCGVGGVGKGQNIGVL